MNILVLLLALQLGHGRADSVAPRRADTKQTQPKPTMTVAEALRKHTDEWMSIPGVTGTGEGLYKKKPCIVVFVERETPALRKKLPKTAEGYHVDIRSVGEVKAR